MGSKILSYGETCINNNKNAFHKKQLQLIFVK